MTLKRKKKTRFSVSEKVMHPQYGPGQVTGVKHRELVEGFEHYYVIELLLNGATLYLPIREVEELGVRPVMSWAKLTRVLATLHDAPRRLSNDFRERQERVRAKLATARPIKLAEVVRDLTNRKQQSYLTKVDKDLLSRGRELLAAEVAAVTGTRMLDAHATINDMLKRKPRTDFHRTERVQEVDTVPTSKQKALASTTV
jgi:CarD family transcriptional regulator